MQTMMQGFDSVLVMSEVEAVVPDRGDESPPPLKMANREADQDGNCAKMGEESELTAAKMKASTSQEVPIRFSLVYGGQKHQVTASPDQLILDFEKTVHELTGERMERFE